MNILRMAAAICLALVLGACSHGNVMTHDVGSMTQKNVTTCTESVTASICSMATYVCKGHQCKLQTVGGGVTSGAATILGAAVSGGATIIASSRGAGTSNSFSPVVIGSAATAVQRTGVNVRVNNGSSSSANAGAQSN